MNDFVWLVEKNVHAAWVIYGAIGIRQYYGYSKREACRRYREECRKNDDCRKEI